MRTFRARLGKAASFGLDDWRVFVEALVTLVVVQVALRIVEFPRLMSWASRARTTEATELSRTETEAPEWRRPEIERLAWFVEVAGRLTGLRCLPRSLALTRVLARRGVTTTLRIGVRTEGHALLAHAWVEWMGRALNDDERSLQPFAAFERALDGISNA